MKLSPRRRKLIINILTIALPILSLVVIYFSLRIALATERPFVAVVGSSMSPSLEGGDLVIVQGASPSNIQIEDIIVFEPPQGVRTIHRVTRMRVQDGTIQFMTKGDAVDHEDDWVSEQYVLGRVIYRIPYLGYLILDPVIIIVVVIVIAVIILVWPQRKGRFSGHKPRKML